MAVGCRLLVFRHHLGGLDSLSIRAAQRQEVRAKPLVAAPPLPEVRCLSAVFLVRRHGQRVASFVLGMPLVAANVRESHGVFGEQLVELPPKVLVLDGLQLVSLATPPAVGLPLGQPLGEALCRRRCCLLTNSTRRRTASGPPGRGSRRSSPCGCSSSPRSPPERSDSICPRLGMPEDERPTARAGVAATGAVGEELDLGRQSRLRWAALHGAIEGGGEITVIFQFQEHAAFAGAKGDCPSPFSFPVARGERLGRLLVGDVHPRPWRTSPGRRPSRTPAAACFFQLPGQADGKRASGAQFALRPRPRPPKAGTSSLTIESPRPVPEYSRVMASPVGTPTVCPWRNFSKMICWSSSAMPDAGVDHPHYQARPARSRSDGDR